MMRSSSLGCLPSHADDNAALSVDEDDDHLDSDSLTGALESMRRSLPKSSSLTPRQHKKINQRRQSKKSSEQEKREARAELLEQLPLPLPTKPSLQSLLSLPTMSDSESASYTPKSKRPSKAKKGLPVHYCDWPGCDKQDQPFTRAEHLRRHQLSHGTLELKCTVDGCEKVFQREDLRMRHMRSHERRSNQQYAPIQPQDQYQEHYQAEAPPYTYEPQVPTTSFPSTIVPSYAHAPDYGNLTYPRSGASQHSTPAYDSRQPGYITPSSYSSSAGYSSQYATVQPSQVGADSVYNANPYEYDPHLHPPSSSRSSHRRGR